MWHKVHGCIVVTRLYQGFHGRHAAGLLLQALVAAGGCATQVVTKLVARERICFWHLQVMGDGSEAAGEGNKFTTDLMDQFFRDPNMQQLLYKYLPEPMRNPQTFEWMLSNPEYRKQLEGMMEQQVPPSCPLTHVNCVCLGL